jgi:hypothetical protein
MMHSCICIDREQQTKLSYLVCAWFIALENDLVWRIFRELMVEAIRVHEFVYRLGSSLLSRSFVQEICNTSLLQCKVKCGRLFKS